MNYEKYIKIMGYETLTPIQTKTIAAFNKIKNIVGVAPTGTGKTHAYLIPLVANIDVTTKECQAVILLPTNELVNQVKLMIEPLVENSEIRLKVYDSKISKSKEFNWLTKNQPHIVITTPEKIIEFSNNGLLINMAKYLVLDEADMMFDEEFLKQIDLFLTKTKNARYLLFSATITQDMHVFIKKYFGVYDLIDTNSEHELKIEQRLIKNNITTREETLTKILDAINPFLCILFVSKKEDQIRILDLLQEKNLNVGLLSSNLNQHQRKNVIKEIRDLKYQYIVASDLASRGLDFDVSHVINFDLPYKLEFFKHRSGRTGRMNKEGIVITIALNSDRNKIKKLEELGNNFIEYKIVKNQMIKVSGDNEKNKLTTQELQLMKKIAKPTKVKPNYRKKNKEKILKAKKEAKRGKYVNNR